MKLRNKGFIKDPETRSLYYDIIREDPDESISKDQSEIERRILALLDADGEKNAQVNVVLSPQDKRSSSEVLGVIYLDIPNDSFFALLERFRGSLGDLVSLLLNSTFHQLKSDLRFSLEEALTLRLNTIAIRNMENGMLLAMMDNSK